MSLLQNRWLRAVLLIVVVAAAGWLVRPRASAGGPPMDFALQDMHGKAVNLADYRGKPLLINFWATWCPPCKAEIPWLVALQEKHKASGFTVIGISTDDAAEDIVKFSEEYKINYPMLVGLGHDKLLETFDATAVVPVSWFIHADGSVSQKAVGIHSREWFEAQAQALVEAAR